MRTGTMRAKITADHLERTALVYVRQSTPGQVRDHTESRRRQYGLVDVAREMGFRRVETIDDDLGISGSGFAERPGFQRLLTTVCSGAAGAVLALDASRLARNDRDWSQLVELGAITKVVLIDHDGIYDPRLVNDRLLLGLKGIMSDFEMATLRQRALEAQRTKAQRGELWMHLPVGLVYGPTGAIELDPDARVQQAIRLVLQKFDELGSIRQVLLWLRRERLSVPVTRGGKHGRSTEWASPNYTRVHAIVVSPFLAGAYVYGKSESRTTIVDGRIRRTSGHDLAVEQWQVVIPDHHPGYLDWATYRRHLSMIESNAYMKPGARKSARGGRSLLAGLLRCRRCGYTLQISYGGRDSASPYFRCVRRHHQTGSEVCVSCSGNAVEAAVGEQILQAIAPQAIDAAIAAAQRANERHREQRQALELEIEQARYDAQLAARRYERVDPDRRLVAAELEARWNTALERVRELEGRLATFDTRTVPQQQIDERTLRVLAEDVPALWHDPTIDMRLKQRIVRILIHEIIVDTDDASREVVLVIHWQGGRHTELRVATPWSGRTKRCSDPEAIALVRRMAGRWGDDAIAAQLNLLGWRTGAGNHWTRMRVRELRNRLDLPACDATQPAWLTAKGAARHLGISPAYAGLLLKRGIIPGTQIVHGSMWWVDPAVLDSKDLRDTLRALRERRLVKRDLDNRTLKIPGISDV
jgi:DNA invertase Pin-like site-specific DNA recombinase